MWKPLSGIKKAIVFLGEGDDDGTAQYHATGFLLDIDGIYHVATAKHVIVRQETGERIDDGLRAYFNLEGGRIGSRTFETIKYRFGVDWVFHEDLAADIALIPFGLDEKNDDVRVIPDKMFLADVEQLSELYDVFFLSYQPGIEAEVTISPTIRSGTIARLNEDGTFYIDCAAFPGNSGSPVFLKPSSIRFDEGGIKSGGDALGGNFIGIVGEYLPYRDVAISRQTGRPRVIFEENTGLSRVWSVTHLRELMESQPFKEQLAALKEMTRKA